MFYHKMEEFRQQLPAKYRNVSYLNKSLAEMASAFGTTIGDLFRMDFNTIPLDAIVRWCGHFHTRYLYAHVLLSRDNHYCLIKEFEKKRDYALEREKIVEELNREYNLTENKFTGSLMTFRILYDYFDTYTKLFSLAEIDILEKIDDIKGNESCNITSLVKCAKFVMQKRGISCDNMDRLYDIRYKLKSHERFRLLSDWHSHICDLAEQKHRQRLAKSSSCLEETLAFHLTHETSKVTLFEDYIEHTFQNKIYTENPKIKQFLRECTIDNIVDMICHTYDNVECHNERVKSQHTKHSALQHVNYCLSILKVIPDVSCSLYLKTLKPSILLNRIEDRREYTSQELRRHFYREEIDKLFDACKNDIEFTCVLRLLRETGLRVNALVSMRISNVTDFNGTPKAETSVLDKGRKLRTLMLSDNMRANLEEYLAQRSPINRDDYLFTQKTNRNKHMTTMYVRKQLIRLANECDIHGIHVHPHAFRHTLVNNLMSMGNDIHNVSKFLGHSSTSTTEQYYWTSKISDITLNMTIPWLNKFQTVKESGDDESDDDDDMEQIAVDILMVCVSILTQEQRESLKQRIPNIDTIIEQLYSNVSSIGAN